MPTPLNKYLEALKENGNLTGLAALVVVSAATLSPLPLLAGLVVEAAYLLFVPDSKWYAVRLSRRNDADIERRRAQLKAQTFAVIDNEMQARYSRLENIRRQIDGNVPDDQHWFREVLRNLDYLLEKFLLFSAKEAEFRGYVGSVWLDECANRSAPGFGHFARGGLKPRRTFAEGQFVDLPPATSVPTMVTQVQDSYGREIEGLQSKQGAETDDNTKAVMEKRIEVLTQRRDNFAKIGRILTNLRYQLELLEDTFGLINDQLRARSPEQVLADIDSVVTQTDSMTQLLEELAPFEQMAS